MSLICFIVLFLTYFQSLDCLSGKEVKISRFNFFDTDLLRFSAEERKGNVVISPASVKSTLAMLLEGASGETAREIRNALRLSPDKNEFREQLNAYLNVLRVNDPGVLLLNSNAMFLSNKVNVRKEFAVMLHKVYYSDIRLVDFRQPLAVANLMNSWVSNNTRGLITTLVEPEHIDPLSELVLANTLYFKSKWQHAFDPQQTVGSCFRNHGVCQTVAMMELQADLNYAYVDSLRAHALELPYEGGRYSMFLLIPHDPDGIMSLVRDLPYVSLAQIANLMDQSDVHLFMPKFTIDYNEDMAATLRAMKITTLFSAKADLSGMFNNSSPQVNNIFHKVRMSVDESGTVAAAASAAMVIPLIENGVHIRVDRPFLFFIRDNKMGLVLFEGKIEEPTPFVAAAASKGPESTTANYAPPSARRSPTNLNRLLIFS